MVGLELAVEERQPKIARVDFFVDVFFVLLFVINIIAIFPGVSVQMSKVQVPVGVKSVAFQLEIVFVLLVAVVLKLLGVFDRLCNQVFDFSRGVQNDRRIGVGEQ